MVRISRLVSGKIAICSVSFHSAVDPVQDGFAADFVVTLDYVCGKYLLAYYLLL